MVSRACLDSGIDLRHCRYSHALDRGIQADLWAHHQDRPVEIAITDTRLVPVREWGIASNQPTLNFEAGA